MFGFFDLIGRLLGYGWELVFWAGGVMWKIVTACLDMGFRLVGGILDLLLTPFSWGLDRVLDLGVWSRFDLWGIFWWVLAALLTACLVLALAAVAGNACRRFKRR